MSGAEDVEAIKALKTEYLRCLDDRDYEGLRDVLAPDVRINASRASFAGVQPFLDYLATPGNRPDRTVHIASLPAIDVRSDTEAAGHWQLVANVEFDENDGTTRRLSVRGEYRDRYRRTPSGWRIASSDLQILPR